MTETVNQTAWESYWEGVAPRLADYVSKNRNPLVTRYLTNCLGLYSFVVEDFESKTTSHSDLRPKLSVFLIETHDLMRGVLSCYENLTLAPLGLLLRTIFEIHCNLKFIVRSKDPSIFASRFDRFQEIEQLLHAKQSSNISDPTDAEWERVASRNPEWFETGTIRLKKKHWTAIKGMTLAKIAESPHVDLSDDYNLVYKIHSKFAHASPIIRNLYRKGDSLRSIPDPRQAEGIAMQAQMLAMKTLEESCSFFGVAFPAYDHALISQDMIEALGKPRLVPTDY